MVCVCPQAEINILSAKLAAETRQRQELETEVRSQQQRQLCSCLRGFKQRVQP